jgi:hypothetical protein
MATKQNNDDLTAKAIKWINSSTGKQKLKNAYQRAKKNTDSLDEARRVDPESLKRPITR